MSDTTASLRRKITSAGDLQSVVRTMKSLGRLEHRTIREIGARVGRLLSNRGTGVERVLSGTRAGGLDGETERTRPLTGAIGAVVFGSDQGLVGQFNEVVADYAMKTLAALPGKAPSLGRR